MTLVAPTREEMEKFLRSRGWTVDLKTPTVWKWIDPEFKGSRWRVQDAYALEMSRKPKRKGARG